MESNGGTEIEKRERIQKRRENRREKESEKEKEQRGGWTGQRFIAGLDGPERGK